jgi:hypothetical protein
LGWDTSCGAPIIGLLSTPEIKMLDRKVDIDPWAARRSKSMRRVLQTSGRLSKIFEKSKKIFFNLSKTGGGVIPTSLGRVEPVLTFPWTKGYIMQNLVALALTGTKFIKNRQTNFLL